MLMGENITLTEPAARIALFIGKSKYLLLLFKMRTNSVNIFRKRINRITILLSTCCKTYCFATQNSRFRSVKSKLSFFFRIIFTKLKCFLPLTKQMLFGYRHTERTCYCGRTINSRLSVFTLALSHS